jgi:hypothetical protein
MTIGIMCGECGHACERKEMTHQPLKVPYICTHCKHIYNIFLSTTF